MPISVKSKLDYINLYNQLTKFYDACDAQELIIAQAIHIEKLQEKLNGNKNNSYSAYPAFITSTRGG